MSVNRFINFILGIQPEEIIMAKIKEVKENTISKSMILSPEMVKLSVTEFNKGIFNLGNKVNYTYLNNSVIRIKF